MGRNRKKIKRRRIKEHEAKLRGRSARNERRVYSVGTSSSLEESHTAGRYGGVGRLAAIWLRQRGVRLLPVSATGNIPSNVLSNSPAVTEPTRTSPSSGQTPQLRSGRVPLVLAALDAN
jgi:hypothetical protein